MPSQRTFSQKSPLKEKNQEKAVGAVNSCENGENSCWQLVVVKFDLWDFFRGTTAWHMASILTPPISLSASATLSGSMSLPSSPSMIPGRGPPSLSDPRSPRASRSPIRQGPRRSPARHRRWCLTGFLPKAFYAEHVEVGTRFQWAIIGQETCPETGRTHCQMAVVLKTSTTLRALKALLHDPALHLEVMMGTPAQSRTYCSKEDPTPFEHGILPSQGQALNMMAPTGSLVI